MRHNLSSISLPGLRERAERNLRERESDHHKSGTYELRVHELELRMQHEALRELHEELAQTSERFESLFTHAPIAYLVLDRESVIVEANLAATELLDTERAGLLGRRLSSFLAPDQAERFTRLVRKTLNGSQPQSAELWLVLASGAHRTVQIQTAREPFDPSYWRAAITDVTPLRELEREVEQSARLTAIGTFASGVAHDFANVLASIAAGADVALEVAQEPRLAAIPLQRIRAAADRGRRLVDQLLRFAAAPDSKSRATFPLDTSVRAVEPALRQMLGPSIELHTTLDAPEAEVDLDLGGPEEILLNLASNAKDAMPRGGELRIETKIVRARVGAKEAPPRLWALLRVGDTGQGMDAKTRARVFQPFFTTKANGRGCGLGLAMVLGMVQRGGGHIELESVPGKGTLFSIYLPLEEQ